MRKKEKTMEKERIWHCPKCHFTDCSGSGKLGDKRHRAYRGVDIGECKKKLEVYEQK